MLTPRYDHIIIDSPPVLAVTDATVIGQRVGGTLVALKAGKHPMREIEQAVKRLKRADVDPCGMLYNNVDMESRRYRAGEYSYQYHCKNDR